MIPGRRPIGPRPFPHVVFRIMKILCLLISTALSGSIFAWQHTPVTDDTVVLRVGNFTLTKAAYEQLVMGFDRSSGAVTTGANAQTVQSGEDVARLLALVTEAQRRNIDKDPAIQAQIRVRGYVLLANALLAALGDEMKKDEAGTRTFYSAEQHSYVEVHARHILVRYKGVKSDNPSAKGPTRTEEQAKARAASLYQKLKQGADFAALAKAESDDESTSRKGGDLDYFPRGRMTGEFEIAAFRLPVGGLGEPFKTEFGYHIVQVLDHRPLPYDKVRPALENIRARSKFEELGKTGMELNEAYFRK